MITSKLKKKRKNKEHLYQAALIKWAYIAGRKSKKAAPLLTLFAIPNGQLSLGLIKTRIGKIRLLKYLANEGVRKGVPDLFLPYPSKKYHGLFIEMKTEVGVHGDAQKLWQKNLTKAGYKVVVCRGVENARMELTSYLNLKNC